MWKKKRRNKKVIENYIRNQLQEDIVTDQISVEEYLDSFTGEEIKKDAGKVVRLADLPIPF